MKIGIITFWNEMDNYGAVLQTYALQAYLKRQGYDAFVICHKYKYKPNFLNRILRFLLRGRWLYYFNIKNFLKTRRKSQKRDALTTFAADT